MTPLHLDLTDFRSLELLEGIRGRLEGVGSQKP